jgi:hypothetical protein
MNRLPYDEAVKRRPSGACYCNYDDRECYRRGHWSAMPLKKPPVPGRSYSDAELGVRLDDIREAAVKLLMPGQWFAVRARARKKAIERNLANSKRPDVSGASACHRPLFEDHS